MSKQPYPETLAEQLAAYRAKPTGDVDWDTAILDTLRHRQQADITPWVPLHQAALRLREAALKAQREAANLTDDNVYRAHAAFLMHVANTVVLAPQRRQFVVDDDNRDVLRFLLLYYNNCPLAEEVFPGKGYKLHKPVMLQGGVGVGKTLIMQIFSEYLRQTRNPRFFYNLSVTQMVNYYTIHNNLDRFTYHEEESRGFQCQPVNVCLNDIGIQDKTFFGMDTGLLTDEFLHARNEIWTQYGMFAHLTTNLDNNQLRQRFSKGDGYGRLVDRFKTYNIIPLTGKSRR